MAGRHAPERVTVTRQADASGNARIIQAGGDVHVWEAGGGPAPQALDALPPAPELTGRTAQADEWSRAARGEAHSSRPNGSRGLEHP